LNARNKEKSEGARSQGCLFMGQYDLRREGLRGVEHYPLCKGLRGEIGEVGIRKERVRGRDNILRGNSSKPYQCKHDEEKRGEGGLSFRSPTKKGSSPPGLSS